MQNIWVHPRGARYLPSSEDIVPKIQELLRYCHDRKIPVVYVHTSKRKDLPTSASLPISNRRPMMPIINGAISRARRARKSTSLKPKQNDIVVKKFRYSGFYGTQLENLLRALGRDTIECRRIV